MNWTMTDELAQPEPEPEPEPETRGSRAGREARDREPEAPQSGRGWVKAYAVFRSAVLSLAALLGTVCIVVFGASLVFGVKPLVVISGSMEPTIPVGSVLFTREVPAGELNVGDIVTAARPNGDGDITHRLVSSEEVRDGIYQLVMRGDANKSDDPEPYTVRTAGRYVWHIEKFGDLALFVQTRAGLSLAAAAGLLLIAMFLLDPERFAGRPAEPDKGPAGA
jgi:signal peptidase